MKLTNGDFADPLREDHASGRPSSHSADTTTLGKTPVRCDRGNTAMPAPVIWQHTQG